MSGRRLRAPASVTSRVLAILGSFGPDHAELSLIEISRRSGLASSTTHRLVHELRAQGALERDENRMYRIGPLLRKLAQLPH